VGPAAGLDGFSPQEASVISAAMVAAVAAACRPDERSLFWIMMKWGRMTARQKTGRIKGGPEMTF
jgi:hypothetical protein